MNALVVTAIVLGSLWVATLTLVVLLLVRQIGLITVRLDTAGSALDDGLGIGDSVPAEAVAALPAIGRDLAYLLFMSPSCEPCTEIAPQLGRHELGATVVALFSGTDEMADDFEAQLLPDVETVRDPAATRIAEALRVRSTPFAVEVENGIVTGKAYIRDISDLLRLISARDTSEAAEIARNLTEVVETAS
jgi:hypothetical protein